MESLKTGFIILLALNALWWCKDAELFAQSTYQGFPIGAYWTQPHGGIDLSDELFEQLDSVRVNAPFLVGYKRDGSNHYQVQQSLDKAQAYGMNAMIDLSIASWHDMPGGGGRKLSQRTIFHAENVPIGIEADRDDVFGWHGTYDDFVEPPPPGGDPFKVLRALVGTHSAGLMVKDPSPDKEQQYNTTHYLKPRLRIPAIPQGGEATDDVIEITVKYKSTGVVAKAITINEQDFLDGGSYDGTYKKFSFSYVWSGQQPNVDEGDTLPSFPLGMEPEPGTMTGIQIEVYWFGLVDCWLDYVMVDDDEANRLFTNIK